jgi:hypothetical protein
MTKREQARQEISDQVADVAAQEHRPNYRKLHIRRDGTADFDLIDDKAEHFAAIPSVACVGTGGYACNCDYCNEVYCAADEARAAEDGRKYDREAKYETQEDAISDAVGDSDLSDLEARMLAALDEIEVGYFDDEEAAA